MARFVCLVVVVVVVGFDFRHPSPCRDASVDVTLVTQIIQVG